MSDPFPSRQRLRMPSERTSGLGAVSSFSSLSSLGVTQSAVAFDDDCTLEGCECTLEGCDCEAYLAELAKSFEIFSDEAFTLGEFSITPLRRR